VLLSSYIFRRVAVSKAVIPPLNLRLSPDLWAYLARINIDAVNRRARQCVDVPPSVRQFLLFINRRFFGSFKCYKYRRYWS